ncbi:MULTISPECIES: adenine phosphoribosyltransferase [Kocuria]|uniref:adenine phosphoribosyltransferase n=1 Tax=Kocuria TaxID=57493 RepID=UPI00065FA9AD|nr:MULTISPECIES: adenine phosphoribosyltransferase [Kocuria]MCT1367930.1 adenine phosphoribosyltransferase [Rothia sp. p3-SID1597]RUQ21085.1 adenine phosphoribosyltransferase [Kocuria sp. HSID16901]
MNQFTTPTADERVVQTIEKVCAVIPNYPEPGIIFRDLTPLFADGAAFREVIDALLHRFEGQFDVVAGVEARGFLLASAAAYAAGVGVMPVRKEGKLPRETYSESYSLEYGTATLEIHRDDIPEGSRVLILDDILATGGTLGATVKLMERAGLAVAGIGVVMELDGLSGRNNLSGQAIEALYTV